MSCGPLMRSRISKPSPSCIRCRFANAAPNLVKADFFGYNVELKDDFAVRYALDPAEADTVRVITERETATGPGFFQAQALLKIPSGATDKKVQAAAPRTLIVLFDNSLSMQWDKLERSFAACEAALQAPAPHRFVQSAALQLRRQSRSLRSRVRQRPQNIEQALTFHPQQPDSRRHGSATRPDGRARTNHHQRALPDADQRRRSHRRHGAQRKAGGMVRGGMDASSQRRSGRTRWCSASATMPTCRCFDCSR